MAREYKKALSAVLVHEGGYVNHPRDPGGATNKGVTQRVYDGWRSRRGLDKHSVREITDVEVSAIYKAQYWDVVGGDSLPEGLAYAVFDGAVNSGPVQSVRWLQRALGLKSVDGHMGAATLAAANAHHDHDRLISDMLALRMAFLRRLSTFDVFGEGWTARINDVRKRAQAWAAGSVGPAPTLIPGAAAKALPIDAKGGPSPAAGDVAMGGGLGSGALAGAIKTAQDQLAPVGDVEWVQPVLAVLAVISIALVIGGLGWRAWQTYRAKKHEEALA